MDCLEQNWRQVFIPGLVSVIIPTYNRADVVGNAIRSALVQQGPPLEIIVVDDGSVDHTSEVLACFPSIKVIRQANQGVGAARNAGLQLAAGEFIASLDSDDVWHEDFLSAMMEAMRENNCPVGIAGRERKVEGELQPVRDTPMEKAFVGKRGTTVLLSPNELRAISLASVLSTNPGVVFHRRVVEPWHVFVKTIDEPGQHARVIFRHAPSAVFVPYPLWEVAPLGQDRLSVAGRNDRFDLGWRLYCALREVEREHRANLTPGECKQFARKRSDWLVGDSAYPMSMHGQVVPAFVAYTCALMTDFNAKRARDLVAGVARSLRTLFAKWK